MFHHSTSRLDIALRLSAAVLAAFLTVSPAFATETRGSCAGSSSTVSDSGTARQSESVESEDSQDGEPQGEDPEIDEVNPDPFTSDPKESGISISTLLVRLFGIF